MKLELTQSDAALIVALCANAVDQLMTADAARDERTKVLRDHSVHHCRTVAQKFEDALRGGILVQ